MSTPLYLIFGLLGFGLIFKDVMVARRDGDFKMYKFNISATCTGYMLITGVVMISAGVASVFVPVSAIPALTFILHAAGSAAVGLFLAGTFFIRDKPPF